MRVTEGELAGLVAGTAADLVAAFLERAARASALSVPEDGAADPQDNSAPDAALYVVATDAGSAARWPAVARATAEGRGVVFGDARFLGRFVGRGAVPVLVARHPRIANVIARACAAASIDRTLGIVAAGGALVASPVGRGTETPEEQARKLEDG
jgi:hypothetical protein